MRRRRHKIGENIRQRHLAYFRLLGVLLIIDTKLFQRTTEWAKACHVAQIRRYAWLLIMRSGGCEQALSSRIVDELNAFGKCLASVMCTRLFGISDGEIVSVNGGAAASLRGASLQYDYSSGNIAWLFLLQAAPWRDFAYDHPPRRTRHSQLPSRCGRIQRDIISAWRITRGVDIEASLMTSRHGGRRPAATP